MNKAILGLVVGSAAGFTAGYFAGGSSLMHPHRIGADLYKSRIYTVNANNDSLADIYLKTKVGDAVLINQGDSTYMLGQDVGNAIADSMLQQAKESVQDTFENKIR